MATALAATSIIFRDNHAYSKKLAEGAKNVFAFGREAGRRTRYSRGNPFIEPYYNSTGYYDEYIWGSAWLFYATGNSSAESSAECFISAASDFDGVLQVTFKSSRVKLQKSEFANAVLERAALLRMVENVEHGLIKPVDDGLIKGLIKQADDGLIRGWKVDKLKLLPILL
ncbi:hypothetical protein SASPL_150644 [Salvia splendens]|uniref:cellulase n=1 Tax=Salvia splendens TaxID=180675 RepID=A0A8X8W6X7_SALSN|nr:hypothetical protein SASPL_150644 [Salvia splendens]